MNALSSWTGAVIDTIHRVWEKRDYGILDIMSLGLNFNFVQEMI